jgi:hypothetical protein
MRDASTERSGSLAGGWCIDWKCEWDAGELCPSFPALSDQVASRTLETAAELVGDPPHCPEVGPPTLGKVLLVEHERLLFHPYPDSREPTEGQVLTLLQFWTAASCSNSHHFSPHFANFHPCRPQTTMRAAAFRLSLF